MGTLEYALTLGFGAALAVAVAKLVVPYLDQLSAVAKMVSP